MLARQVFCLLAHAPQSFYFVFLVFLFFETESGYVDEAGFKLKILLPQPPQSLGSQASASMTGLQEAFEREALPPSAVNTFLILCPVPSSLSLAAKLGPASEPLHGLSLCLVTLP
jgi:hypothetical protein